MVYGVVAGYYSDWHIVGYSNNKVDAEKYCAEHNLKTQDENSEFYYDDDYYIIKIGNIKINDDIKNIKLLYEHEIIFDCDDEMRNEPERYEYYVGEKRKISFRYSRRLRNNWFAVKVTADSRAKAEKIAQDYYAKFKYNKETFDLNVAMKLMNVKYNQ